MNHKKIQFSITHHTQHFYIASAKGKGEGGQGGLEKNRRGGLGRREWKVVLATKVHLFPHKYVQNLDIKC